VARGEPWTAGWLMMIFLPVTALTVRLERE